MTTNAWFLRTTSSTNTWTNRLSSTSPTADFVARWDISLTGLWGTLVIDATVDLTADRSFSAQYNILGSVAKDFDAFYLIDGAEVTAVSRDFVLVYQLNEEDSTLEITQDFPVFWTANGVATADFTAEWLMDRDTPADWIGITNEDESWAAQSVTSSTWTPVTTSSTVWANG